MQKIKPGSIWESKEEKLDFLSNTKLKDVVEVKSTTVFGKSKDGIDLGMVNFYSTKLIPITRTKTIGEFLSEFKPKVKK